MIELKFKSGDLSESEQSIVNSGFEKHSISQSAPAYSKTRLNWLAHDSKDTLVSVLTADLLLTKGRGARMSNLSPSRLSVKYSS